MHPNRGILTVGLKTKTVGFVGLIFQRPQIFFHNFVSFHPILMFHTILELGDQTKTIEDEFKTIRSIQINTKVVKQFSFISRYEKTILDSESKPKT
jgi:hypothetical protein